MRSRIDRICPSGRGGAVVGLGLWYSIPGALILESPLLLDDVWLYTSITRATSRTGTWSLVGLLGLTTAIWVSQPWPPPAPSAGAVAGTALALWILLPWARWIEQGQGDIPRLMNPRIPNTGAFKEAVHDRPVTVL